jgi:prepilin-type processing-associated H-X9-DG protein
VSDSSENGGVAEQKSWFRLDVGWRSCRNALILVLLIVGCDCIGMFVSRILPSIQAAREAARRIQCDGNLKKIGAAMQSYHQKYGSFPPSFLADKNGKPMHSWRVLLLPFLGEQGLYAEYRFDEPWNSPNNIALSGRMPAVYHCPSDWESSLSQTSYVMLVGPHAISNGATAHRMGDIKDGAANTIMVAEAGKAGINWLEPRDLDAEKMDYCTRAAEPDVRRETCEMFRNHCGAGNVLFCDGSVRALISKSVNPEELKGMTTIDGGEAVREVW